MTQGTGDAPDDPYGLAEATQGLVAAVHLAGDSETGVFLTSWLISLTATLAAGARSDPRIDLVLAKLEAMETHMSAEMDDLAAQVHANTDVANSAVALINGIADRIAAAAGDPAAVTALADELRASDAALAASVVANTPVVVTPPDTTGGGEATV